MPFILIFFQFITVFSSVYTIVTGLKSFRYIKSNRVLILIPIFSLFQILLSETIFYTKYSEGGKTNYSTELGGQINVLTYTLLEYIVITYFLITIQNNIKIKKILIIISAIPLSLLFLDYSKYNSQNNIITLDTFYMAEGIFFITFLLLTTMIKYRKNSINMLFANSEWIACVGILLGFIILWPNSVIENFFVLNAKDFYNYFFISNSIAYTIMFNIISLSFHASRKSIYH